MTKFTILQLHEVVTGKYTDKSMCGQWSVKSCCSQIAETRDGKF